MEKLKRSSIWNLSSPNVTCFNPPETDFQPYPEPWPYSARNIISSSWGIRVNCFTRIFFQAKFGYNRFATFTQTSLHYPVVRATTWWLHSCTDQPTFVSILAIRTTIDVLCTMWEHIIGSRTSEQNGRSNSYMPLASPSNQISVTRLWASKKWPLFSLADILIIRAVFFVHLVAELNHQRLESSNKCGWWCG